MTLYENLDLILKLEFQSKHWNVKRLEEQKSVEKTW